MQLSDFSIDALKEFVTGDNKLTPYLSGPKIIDFFRPFGVRDIYKMDDRGLPGGISRNPYAVKILTQLNGTKHMKPMVESLVDSRRFINSGFDVDDAVEKINEVIKYDGYKLELIDELYKIVGEDLPEETEVEIHFEDIQEEIIDQIKLAKFCIWIAVAWFTDNAIFQELIKKKNDGLNIQVIINNDDINSNYGVDLESNFETFKIDPKGFFKNIMHHKFCIIDFKTVIHGSFNWTNKARWNNETISIDTGREIAEKFADEFMKLKST